MTLGNRLFKVLTWLLVSAVLLPGAVTLLMLAINWSDRPPSAAAQKFQHILDSRPAVSDSDNAYVYAQGFAIARPLDPLAWGRKRIDWIDSMSDRTSASAFDHPPGEYSSFGKYRSQPIEKLGDVCPNPPGEVCYDAMRNADAVVAEWLLSEGWVLNRYRALISRPVWREEVPRHTSAPFPPYSEMLEGQKLLLLRAWQLADRGDVAAVRALLGEDIRFWRMVLASADVLLTKMIATAAMDRHFAWSNLVLRRLPETGVDEAVPESWLRPLSGPELSMERCFAGEWRYSHHMVFGIADWPDLWQVAAGDPDSGGVITQLTRRAQGLLLQPQATSNITADTLLATSDVLRVPLEELPRAVEALEREARAPDERGIQLYNPVGVILASVATPSYASYAARVADLEGIRRAALLTARLRNRGAMPEPRQMRRLLHESDLRDPYDGEPFAWSNDSSAIVFSGLESGDRGRHAFLY